jgi:GrpB-like predicted nucleotidyltransferase (UPF0157 family)
MSQDIGLEQNKVRLSPHSEEWRLIFEAERDTLHELLGDHIFEIHHIGSTSVPGLSAKPIIDILVALHRFSDMELLHQKMEKAGYEHRENGSSELRVLFVKGSEENRTHHIHFTEHQSEEWEKAFLFWNYLRTHQEELKAYEALKKELAAQYPEEREQYSKGKADFIKGIIQKARALL